MGDVGNHQLRYKSNRQNLVIRLFAATCHNTNFFENKWKDLSDISEDYLIDVGPNEGSESIVKREIKK